MNWCDAEVMSLLGGCSLGSNAFDEFIRLLLPNYLVKGGFFCCAFFWLWYGSRAHPTGAARRERLLAMLPASFLALAVARLLVAVLPLRLRPLHDPALGLGAAQGIVASGASPENSFPSDHAALFVALAVGLYFVSRRTGLLALAYAIAFILFPRVYACYHFATDVFAGAAIGLFFAWLVQWRRLREPNARLWLAWHDAHPGSFHAFLWLWFFNLSVLFDPVRQFAGGALAIVRQALGG